MTENHYIKPLEVIHLECCGIDIHKDTAVVCLNSIDKNTGEIQERVRTFSCFTDDLQEMRKWLKDNNCSIVALESTGVYWRPVHNILEDEMEVVLVNARHFKNVPGRKTDVNDSQWLCNLLRYGLLKGSFIPSSEVRDWRELTRLRRNLIKDLANYKRQVHKIFQTSNIKIDSVVSDLFGVTGCNLMDLLCNGQSVTIESIEACTRGTLKQKVKELHRSVQGFFREHHSYQIKILRDLILNITEQIENLNKRIQQLMGGQDEILDRLQKIPGIQSKSAQVILSEIGYDLMTFETEASLSSWAGVAPGNHQSAGKSKSGKNPVRKHVFKEALIQIAWAAIKKKGSFWKDKYYRLKTRRGAQKAIVAIAHKILKVIFRVIKYKEDYKEIGQELKDEQKNRQLKRLKKQAHSLGYKLALTEAN